MVGFVGVVVGSGGSCALVKNIWLLILVNKVVKVEFNSGIIWSLARALRLCIKDVIVVVGRMGIGRAVQVGAIWLLGMNPEEKVKMGNGVGMEVEGVGRHGEKLEDILGVSFEVM